MIDNVSRNAKQSNKKSLLKQENERPETLDKFMITVGGILIICGILWPYLAKIGFGQLPGDFAIHGEKSSFYFPLATCFILSLLLSLGSWIFRLFK